VSNDWPKDPEVENDISQMELCSDSDEPDPTDFTEERRFTPVNIRTARNKLKSEIRTVLFVGLGR
jgi:hypothetical protein